jgi:hypothetical protein
MYISIKTWTQLLVDTATVKHSQNKTHCLSLLDL